MTVKDLVINIDTNDFNNPKYLAKFIEKYKHIPSIINGINTEGEFTYITINEKENNVSVVTVQENDRVRHNVYYTDGTSEQWFGE